MPKSNTDHLPLTIKVFPGRYQIIGNLALPWHVVLKQYVTEHSGYFENLEPRSYYFNLIDDQNTCLLTPIELIN